ncbi:MAG: hypothetical protein AB7V14_04030 [Kiritimatiellia bacterium]
MKTFAFWLILLIVLMGHGLSTKYELALDGNQLTLKRVDYWGFKTSATYQGTGIERFEFGKGPFPVMVKGKVRYHLKLYDPDGALIPLPRALGEVYGDERVKDLTGKLRAGIQQGHFRRTGYVHKMCIALGVFPLIFSTLYGASYVADRHRKGKPKTKMPQDVAGYRRQSAPQPEPNVCQSEYDNREI